VFEIAIDTGGTFTDAVLQDDQQKITVAKYPTNPVDPSEGIMGCIGVLAEKLGMAAADVVAATGTLVIGTTLPTNAVTVRKGAKCCLIYTEGFKDILEISRRIPKANTFNLRVPPPEVLIPRYLRFGIRERIQYDGQVITPLNEEDVRRAVRKAKANGVEVPIVCFLHSYINPSHEERVAELIRDEYPNAVLSSHILQSRLEGYRFHTAVLAGYVKPVLANFTQTLIERLKANRFNGTLLFITCAGGVAAPELCLDNPSLTIGSGPAAGPLFASLLGELAGPEDILSLDIGGTTADLAILPERRITTTTETIIADHHKGTESVDVASIAMGGGTIAWIDKRGMLRVGPDSAGADPGPACYAKGGSRPTVTDANVVLGVIPTDYFLGGKIPLDRQRAVRAVRDGVAKPLQLETLPAAYAIVRLAEENLAREIFLSFVKKGFDPRDFVLVMGGGGGPVHAAAVAAALGIGEAYIPKHAAVFCPVGILLADYKHILSRFYHRSGREITAGGLADAYAALEAEGVEILKRQKIAKKDMRLVRGADIRYYGQLHDIEVLLPTSRPGAPFSEGTVQALIDGFHRRHEQIYGRSNPSIPVTIETLKLHAVGKRPALRLAPEALDGKSPKAALKRRRPVYFPETGLKDTPCYDGDRLNPGNTLRGPAVIEESQTTILVPGGWTLAVDAYRNYILRR
jgi:N-methylhydantoinase A